MLTEIKEAFDSAAADASVRVIVLTGEGRGCSAGADLMAKMPSDTQGRPDLLQPSHLDDAGITEAGHCGGERQALASRLMNDRFRRNLSVHHGHSEGRLSTHCGRSTVPGCRRPAKVTVEIEVRPHLTIGGEAGQSGSTGIGLNYNY